MSYNLQVKVDRLLNKNEDTKLENVDSSTTKVEESQLPGQEVTLRYLKEKHKFKICDIWTPKSIFARVSAFLSCIEGTMRIIHKGKQLKEDNILSAIHKGAVWQVS